jgi:hypothetical protein
MPVPAVNPSTCPPDCKQEQEKLLKWREQVVSSGLPKIDVLAFNLRTLAHNVRCGVAYFVQLLPFN